MATRFSVSLLGTYETCSYKCKMEYNVIGEEKSDDIEQNFYGEHGALLHSLFESYYTSDPRPTQSQMEAMYYSGINDLTTEFPDGKKEEFIQNAIKQIEWFYDKWSHIEPVGVEVEFDEFFIEGVPLHFKGFIDRIDGSIDNKSVTVCDYKTGGSTKFTKKELSDNIQATIYALWFKEKYGFYPERFVFIFTKERKIKEIIINETFIERGLARIKRNTDNIQNGIYFPEAKGGVYFCKKFCSYYKRDDEKSCPKFQNNNIPKSGWDI